MATLDPQDGHVTLINTFTVAPEQAERLLALLADATETTMRHRPGFVSANLHMSTDRTRVANYAQWRSQADFDAMMRDPGAQAHTKEAAGIATTNAGTAYIYPNACLPDSPGNQVLGMLSPDFEHGGRRYCEKTWNWWCGDRSGRHLLL